MIETLLQPDLKKPHLNIHFKNPFPLFSNETFLGTFISSNVRDENQKETRKSGEGATQELSRKLLGCTENGLTLSTDF